MADGAYMSVSRDDFRTYRKHLRLIERTYPRMEGDSISVGIPQFSLTYLHQQAYVIRPRMQPPLPQRKGS